MPGSDRAFIERSMRLLIVGVAIAGVVLLLLYLLKAALTPLAAAFVLAYLLDPLIDRFERRRVRRSFAILVLVGVLGIGVAGALLFLLPRLQREVTSLAQAFPGYVDHAVTTWVPALEARFGIHLPHTVSETLATLRAGGMPLPLDALQSLITRVLGFFTGTASALVGLLVIPVLAYYVLVEFDGIGPRVLGWIPPRHREYVREKARVVDALVSGFIRGQLLVAAALGALYAIGFTVIGIDLAVGIGVAAGMLALIPYLGSAVAVSSASLLAVLKFGVDGHLLAVLVWYVVVQAFEGFVLTPRIVGQTVGLHPVAVIVALLIGGDLLGFLGLLVAVPAAAVLKVFLGELRDAYRGSSFFAETAEPPGDVP